MHFFEFHIYIYIYIYINIYIYIYKDDLNLKSFVVFEAYDLHTSTSIHTYTLNKTGSTMYHNFYYCILAYHIMWKLKKIIKVVIRFCKIRNRFINFWRFFYSEIIHYAHTLELIFTQLLDSQNLHILIETNVLI